MQMAEIHYFQRYSTVENTVTNNTLQLIQRINSYSPIKASLFLNELVNASKSMNDPLAVGLAITQQQRNKNSVPDGRISQSGFTIVVETKVDAYVDIEQLKRHAESFSLTNNKKILLLLSRAVTDINTTQLEEKLKAEFPDLLFAHSTFERICEIAQGLFQSHEGEIVAIVEDYIQYCNEQKLVDQSKFLLRIVPCGQSIDLNIKYGIYFSPSDRGYTEHSYVGVYKDKKVQAIWAIDSIMDARLTSEGLEKKYVYGSPTNQYDAKITAIIHEAKTHCGYDIKEGHRFFCGQPFPTDYRKKTPYGIQGARFKNLKVLIEKCNSVTDLAKMLCLEEWE